MIRGSSESSEVEQKEKRSCQEELCEIEKKARALDALLALIEVPGNNFSKGARAEIVKGIMAREERREGSERKWVELLYTCLECQFIVLARLDSEMGALQVQAVMAETVDYESFWSRQVQDKPLSAVLQATGSLELLQGGEILPIDSLHILARQIEQPVNTLVAPIGQGQDLIGIVLFGSGIDRRLVSSAELVLMKAFTRVMAMMMQREKELEENEKVQAALQVANEELERLKKMKSNFVATISHEFRTALTGIQGFSEIIRDQDLSLESTKEFAVDIYADAKRLVRMINDMLDLERMESGSMKLNKEWLNLNAIIYTVVMRMRSSTSQHVIRLHLARAVPILLGDKEKLTQVIVNLVSNAIEYAPDGGEIAVSTLVEGNVVHVHVSDQGVGISERDLERIFERYGEIKLKETRYLSGSGLGLPIAREIIHLHGGEMWVESTPGKGSIFHFTVRFADMR